MENENGIKEKEFDYEEQWLLQEPAKKPHQQLADELGLFDEDELPVSPTIKVIRKYSQKMTLPDLSPEEMLTWQEIARQLFEKDYKAIADLDKIRTEVRLAVKNFKKEQREYLDSDNDKRTAVEYSGEIRYKILAVEKEPEHKSYRYFEKVKVMTPFGVYENEVDTSAFNTIDFQSQRPEFDRFGYKIKKMKEKLMDLVITYSVLVESNNTDKEGIERVKQKLLAMYDEFTEAKNRRQKRFS